jgi:hypothetical protein
MTLTMETAAELDAFVAKPLRRYAFVNYGNVEHFAGAVAAHVQANEVPRDPFVVLPALGIHLERERLSRGSRAVWVRVNDTYVIHYSQYEAHASARFSLWHEFFEILAKQRTFPSAFTTEWREKLADRFAAAILMPEQAVRTETGRFSTNAECLPAILADRFGVSLTAMRRRLRQLGESDSGAVRRSRG